VCQTLQVVPAVASPATAQWRPGKRSYAGLEVFGACFRAPRELLLFLLHAVWSQGGYVQGKNLLGFVSAGHACQMGVVFAAPGSDEPAPTIRLKAIGKHPAEELPLFSNTEGSQVCGQVSTRLPYPRLVCVDVCNLAEAWTDAK
jgi:hypothetical protein